MESKTVYRALRLRRRVEEVPSEQLNRFVEVQQEFRKWVTEWYLSGFKALMPEQNPLKYFAHRLKFALKLIPTNGLKNGEWRVPLPFNAQLRVNNERDMSSGVFVDLPKREVRIRKWGGDTIVIKLKESDAKWILERVREGGKLRLAMAWVGLTKRSNLATFNVALVFAREVTSIEVRRIIAVDLNALHNGVVWGVVEGDKIVKRKIERPDLFKIRRLQKEISRLDSLCAKRGEPYCRQVSAAKSRLHRILRKFEDDAAKEIVEAALKKKAMIVVDAPKDKSIRKIKEGRYNPQKKALLDVGRLRRRIEQLAEWYGVPYREERLYSTVCPHCGGKMVELPKRVMRCPQCGFETHRDEIPLLWAARRFSQLLQPPSFSGLLAARP